MKHIRKIVVAVDFSEHVDPVLDAAVDFARQFNAELHLVHAFDVRIPLVTPYEVAIPTAFIEAASAIVDMAEELEADLIIMGTRGHTGLKHVLLGSVAERTLRHAPCSVLTVKVCPD